MKNFGMFLVLMALCTFAFTGCAKKPEKKPTPPPTTETVPADETPAPDAAPTGETPVAPTGDAPVVDPAK